ncbi:MAG: DUF2589 domain-containing protein [Porphyromonadaceae bacterium]|nr:DUF2589 domain-containing protein [Porphyromonadaceae bacterium]
MKGLPFHHLIGGPLKACIAAQEQASMSTWHYIRDVGLEANGKEAVMVSFSFINNGTKAYLRIPLLTLVPVPYFSIDTLEISFRAKVTGVNASLSNSESKISATYATTSGDTTTTQLENTIDVAVRATQDHVPSGLSKVLGFMEQSVVPESIYMQLRDPEIARAIARGCVKSVPEKIAPDYSFGSKSETEASIKLPEKNHIERAAIDKIKALNIPHDQFPFFSIDDFGAFHSLYAFRCTRLNLSAVQAFSMSRLADLRYLELWGNGEKLAEGQHRANMDFGWLEQIYTLVLCKWGAGFIPQVLLTSAVHLTKLVIKECVHDVVDISYCNRLTHLNIEHSRIRRLVVSRWFEENRKKYEYVLPEGIEIIRRQ